MSFILSDFTFWEKIAAYYLLFDLYILPGLFYLIADFLEFEFYLEDILSNLYLMRFIGFIKLFLFFFFFSVIYFFKLSFTEDIFFISFSSFLEYFIKNYYLSFNPKVYLFISFFLSFSALISSLYNLLSKFFIFLSMDIISY